MRKEPHDPYDLFDYVHSDVTIRCHGNSRHYDIAHEINEGEACDKFFNLGWREIGDNVYCPECAKKKLKQ